MKISEMNNPKTKIFKFLLNFNIFKNFLFFIFLFFSLIPNTVLSNNLYEINAKSIEYIDDNFFASGGVTGKFDNIIIYSDSLNGNTKTGLISLNKNITFKKDLLLWLCDNANYNYLSNTGLLNNVNINFNQSILNANSVNVTSNKNYSISSALLTRCPWNNPCHEISFNNSILDTNGIINCKEILFKYKSIPIVYFPAWKFDTKKKYSSNNINIGKNNNLGRYISYQSYLNPNKDLNGSGEVTFFEERGIGVNPKLFFNTKKSDIKVDAFYISDKDPYKRYNSPSQIDEINTDRYKFRLNAQHKFSDYYYLNSKFLYLSDSYINEEYFRTDYINEVQPENRASLVYGDEFIGSELYVSTRLNDFYSNLNRLDMLANIYRMRIPETPFYYQGKVELSQLNYRNNDLLDNYSDLFRLYNNHMIYLPLKLGFINFIPKAELGYIFYSSSLNESDLDRSYSSIGLESSFQANKIIHKDKAWYGNGLRHVIKPYLDYEYSSYSTGTNFTFQYDKLDTFYNKNNIKIGLNQLFQTKRDNKNKRLIEIDLYSYYSFNNDKKDQSSDYLHADAMFSLNDYLSVDYLAAIDVYDNKSPYMMTRLRYNNSSIDLFLSHLKLSNNKSLFSTKLELSPREDLVIDSYLRYNEEENNIEQASITGYITNCCFEYGVGYRLSSRNDHQVIFSLRLSSF